MKRTLTICLALLVVASITAVAADQRYTTTDDGRRIIANSASEVVVPAIRNDATLKTLFNNLSDYKYGTYFCCYAEVISGPNGMAGEPVWYGVPFTPNANVKLTKVEAGVGYSMGTNSVAIWLAADASGLPGSTLAGPVDVNNLPGFGTCCTLAVAKFKSVPLTKGTQYWIVLGTDSNSMDTTDVWNFNTTDMRNHSYALHNGSYWVAEDSLLGAIGIFGK